MENIIDLLKGKKAYIVGIVQIILGYLTDSMEMMMLGFSTITVRAGISKINK